MHASSHDADDFSASDAITIRRTGSFELDMPPEKALPLFTAVGEKLWIPTWDPVVLNGDGFEKGTVFVTSGRGHTTYWLVIDYDTRAHHALYARVTPEIATGTVDVSLAPTGEGGSTVNVTYQLTASSYAGVESLQGSYSESQFARMMVNWRTMIERSRKDIDEYFGR